MTTRRPFASGLGALLVALAIVACPTRALAGDGGADGAARDAGAAPADAAMPTTTSTSAAADAASPPANNTSAPAPSNTTADSGVANGSSDSAPPASNGPAIDAPHADAPAGSAGPSPGQESGAAPPAPGTERTETGDVVDYYTPRFEPAGFPIVGGNSDIGVLFGVAGTLSRFQDGVRPYFWNMDVVVDASIKGGPTGAEIAQQNYRWQWDIVGLFNGHVRMNPAAYFQRTVDQGYWSVGNATQSVKPAGLTAEAAGRYFQFVMNEARAWNSVRMELRRPLSLQISTIARYVNPEVYAGSQLDIDRSTFDSNGRPLIRGAREIFFTELSAVVIYDTRDDEIMPSKGLHHRLWLKYVQGFPFDAGVAYGSVGFALAQYVHLGGPFVFASRVLADAEFGDVPFYDLFRGNTPFPLDMPGGGAAVRGVPSGRYLGLLKVVANAEIRALLIGFHIFGQSFKIGANLFFDTGRVWTDYTFNNPRDGSFWNWKFGTGFGLYLRWGQAAIFRAEFAYSPDQATENPGFPIGIYVEDGVMF